MAQRRPNSIILGEKMQTAQSSLFGLPQKSIPKLQVIYEPKGRAKEYAARAANLFSGCGHGCLYCYAPSATRKTREDFINASPRHDILQKLEADLKQLTGQDIEPVLMSFTCDPYQPCEGETQLTRKAIELFRKYDVPFQVLTKGGMRSARDFNFYGQKDVFASSLTFLDPVKSLEWEPKAALPEDRIEAIKMAHDMQIKTWVSLEPVIDPAESLEIIRQTHEFVDLYKIGTLNHHPAGKLIDWAEFGRNVVELLEKLHKKSYIKEDLRKYL